MTKTVLIFHAGCWDGWGSAMVARDALGGDPHLVPAHYGMDPYRLQALAERADVYVLDFSFKPDEMMWLAGTAKTLTWIDHHKTAVEAMQPVLAGMPWSFHCRIDAGHPEYARSGIGLTWDHFHDTRSPWLVNYIEDRDLWRKALDDHEEVSMWIRSHGQTTEAWREMGGALLAHAREQGAAMYAYHRRLVTNAAANAIWVHIGNEAMPLVSCSYDLGSDVCDHLLETEDLDVAAYWLLNKHGEYQYGFRSRSGYDCSLLAKRYGGGGHAQAAGCQAATQLHKVIKR
jgi:uncharacterized protein